MRRYANLWSERARRGRTISSTSLDRKSTRLNSSHLVISYAVFCLKKKVLPQLNITHTIDHRPDRPENWFLVSDLTDTQFRPKLTANPRLIQIPPASHPPIKTWGSD